MKALPTFLRRVVQRFEGIHFKMTTPVMSSSALDTQFENPCGVDVVDTMISSSGLSQLVSASPAPVPGMEVISRAEALYIQLANRTPSKRTSVIASQTHTTFIGSHFMALYTS